MTTAIRIDTLGLDIGRVIIEGHGRGDTALVAQDPLTTPPIPGALDGIRRLVRERFDDRAYLVSRCGARMEAQTRAWLQHQRFAEHTGITEERWHFCRFQRHHTEKAPICARLGITHFVDDRLDMLQSLTGIVSHRFWFCPNPNPREMEYVRTHAVCVTRVETWDALVRAILATSGAFP